MTDETKIKLMEALGKSGMSVGQLILENTGSITYNDHRGAEKKEETKGECPSASKDAIMEYVNRLKPLVKVEYQAHYEKIWMCILESSSDMFQLHFLLPFLAKTYPDQQIHYPAKGHIFFLHKIHTY
jgi:hypothetical protein